MYYFRCLQAFTLLLGFPFIVSAWNRDDFAYKEQCVKDVARNNSTKVPISYGMILFPSFEILDVFGPLQVFKMLASQYHLELALISETLEPVSPEPRLPAFNRLNSTFFPEVLPTHTLETAPTGVDVLIVPGGGGTRASDEELEPYFEYLRNTFPQLKYLVTVCTGSLLVGRAGLLEGIRATTNKRAFEQVNTTVPGVRWEPTARWVVDGNVWTSSGISAGIDISLEFVECIYGEALAKQIADDMEYDRHMDPRWDPFSRIEAFGVAEDFTSSDHSVTSQHVMV